MSAFFCPRGYSLAAPLESVDSPEVVTENLVLVSFHHVVFFYCWEKEVYHQHAQEFAMVAAC